MLQCKKASIKEEIKVIKPQKMYRQFENKKLNAIR